MKLFIWRHNRKFHSYSMINEPNIHQDLYTDAIAIVVAETQEKAYELLAAQNRGWLISDLEKLEPRIFNCAEAGVVFEEIRGG